METWTFKALSFSSPCTFSPLCHQLKPLSVALWLFFSWFTLQPFVLSCSLYSYSPFTFSKVQLHSPYPIIKTIFPFRSGLLFPPWDEQPAFHRKVLSLPWIRRINSIYLACSFHCSLTNGNVLLEGVHLTFHTKGVRGVSATPLALLWSFFFRLWLNYWSH